MERMRWFVDDRGFQTSSCGRFVIGSSVWGKDGSTYVALRDNKTCVTYPCRTLASAKTAARNLLRGK